MIGDREHPNRPTDYGAIWFGHGVELAQRFEALATHLDDHGHTETAELIRDVLNADHDPRPPTQPQLTTPPLRPAIPDDTQTSYQDPSRRSSNNRW